MDGIGRLALSMPAEYMDYLEISRPDTLGHPDPELRSYYWRRYIDSPEADRWKVRDKL